MKKDYKRELQLCMLDMMKDIDKLCKKHKIKYYLAYGSCLGAVRHQGFIPWDDDFDIMLKYEEYKRFIDICKKELDPTKYFVQTPETDNNYYLSFGKIRNIQTTLVEEGNKDENIVFGVYIDVFPLTGCPSSYLKKSFLKINRAFVLSANRNVINNRFLKMIFKFILKIFGKKRIIDFCTKQCLKYKCDDCEEIVSIFDGDSFQTGWTTNNILGNPIYVKFEDMELPIPAKYDEYLTNTYGNYMEIPSQEYILQRTHLPHYLDLSKPQAEYKKEINKK